MDDAEAQTSNLRVILIGFMGAGKSTTGPVLATLLKVPFLDMDVLVEERAGGRSISSIVQEDGEAAFRKLEEEVASMLRGVSAGVVACGGGVVEYPRTMSALLGERVERVPDQELSPSAADASGRDRRHTVTIFLEASFDTIAERLQKEGAGSRPLFRSLDRARDLYDRRLPLYRRYADIVLLTDTLPPSQAAHIIASRIICSDN